MPISLPHPLTPQEIRVLQEFRRMSADTLTADAIRNIKHPAGGGDEPALSLVQKGYLTADESRQNFSLTPKSKEFLAIDYKPIEPAAGKPAE